MASQTPMMRQYQELKAKYADCILLFRLGDFYEMFEEDAIEGSRLLNLTLTKRQSTPMCGVPFHAVESYIGRLTRAGKKVAICEQLSDPRAGGIVDRGVVRVVTPGTTFDERILEQKANRFIMSVAIVKGQIGAAAIDLTTGLFYVMAPKNENELHEEIFRLSPAECIVDSAEKHLPDFLKNFEKMPVFPHQSWDEPSAFLARFFGVKNLEGFGLANAPHLCAAATLLLSYLRETQKSNLTHIRPPQLLNRSGEVVLDETAVRNLELLSNVRGESREGSLLAVIDMTNTAMGGRMLRHWLLHPLANKENISKRLDAVSELKDSIELRSGLSDILGKILDLERLLGRLSVGTGSGRDLLGIGLSLMGLCVFREILAKSQSALLRSLHESAENLKSLDTFSETLKRALVDTPPLSVREGGMIREGYSAELDELRDAARHGKNYIQKMQAEEIAKTGIQSLKIRFNQIFGYYIEVTNSNASRVPAHYIRKQTMANAERFETAELKEFEEKILGAEEKMKKIEYEIFLSLRTQTIALTREIQDSAQLLAAADALLSLSLVAEKNRYVRPQIVDSGNALVIVEGRHPVVEQLAAGQFVPNDVSLGKNSPSGANMIVITGPNMGGKSTYLRQTALIVLLAHIGSFVPASSAAIPIVDRIFTRVGANDNLVRGQSTFMVEMQETAQILHYATSNSLIILDEIGRGTSTYDGVSLAWAILEYIHSALGALTLFATHYHELIPVAEQLPHAANYSVAVKEERDSIVFLYRVLPGAVDRSYGIEVARLAGLPKQVIAQARSILDDLEKGIVDRAVETRVEKQPSENQLELFAARPHRALSELEKIDINSLTPLEALQKLNELKSSLGDE